MSPSELPEVSCSVAARERQDPMLGTAPPQRRYLLVEQEGGWGRTGFPELALQGDIRDEVQRRAEAAGARVMLIRRPGRHASSVCLMRAWCVVDTQAPAGHKVTWGTWAYPAELLSAVERVEELAAAADLPAADEPVEKQGDVDPIPSSSVDEPLILVCTHGKKDPCCAVRGRPVAAALAARHPEATWECSHTGGDRFAANVLLLPDGAIYGGLDVDSALAAVDAHRDGRPDTAHLRGISGWPRPVQAAVVAVHEKAGPLPWGSVRPVGTRPLAPAAGQVEASTVLLRLADGRRAQVDVQEHVRPAAQLTCRTDATKVSQVPVATAVRFDPAS
ncbi:sucrase ferredoxin [Ornithinimicrobium panacihumi]|uniref:sucrase ferredoxin n=1 Tax=Ornithinimicrobium panacihumi TaxID=2008449 RepID=UPI003F8870AC